MALRTTHDRVDTRHELVLVERLGHGIVGAEAEAANLVLDAGHAGQDQDRRLHLGKPKSSQDFIARHVGEIEVKQNDVVVVQLAEVDAFFTEIGGIDVEALRFQHQFDALCGCTVVFYQQNAHSIPLFCCRTVSHGHPVSEQYVPESEAAIEWLTKPNSTWQVKTDCSAISFTILNLKPNPHVKSLTFRFNGRA